MARSIEERLEALSETAKRGARNVRADVTAIEDWAELAELAAPAHREALTAVSRSFAQNTERLETGAGGAAPEAVRTALNKATQHLRADMDRLEALGAELAPNEEAREALDSLLVWMGKHVAWIETSIAADDGQG